MKVKTRKITVQDIVSSEEAGFANTDPMKREVRKNILPASDTAELNTMVKMMIILTKFHLGEEVSSEELAYLKDNLVFLEEYKQRLRDKETEALVNIPPEVDYYIDK